mmetsp:Transcript_10813/g.18942  ORF Transcript_10813/g.18942 Transcript_10813/m.18942 type:complete len:595 (-) Transcript_10813:80-1864(-)
MCRPLSANVFHVYALAWVLVSSCVASLADASTKLRLRDAQSSQEAASAGSQNSVMSMVEAGPPSQSENIQYLLSTLDKFKDFATDSRQGVEKRHEEEEFRLQAAQTQTKDVGVQLALNQSMTSNRQSLLETKRIYNNMVSFANSMADLLSATTSKGSACEQFSCGDHASCTDTTAGAQCVCNEGYVGSGLQDCQAPPEFMPHRLLFEGTSGGIQTRAADMHVAAFGKNHIAVVFRDKTRNHMGRICVGNIREAGLVDISAPEQFTQPKLQAFDPVVVGTEDRRLVVTWRDVEKGGGCWARGAAMGISGIRGADQSLSWGAPTSFCRGQAHKMAAVPVPGNRVVVFFADKVAGSVYTPEEKFGNSLLLHVGDFGGLTRIGTNRFAEYPVCRLEVTKLTPSSFVIAARAGQATDEMDSSVVTNQEALAVFGEVLDNDLVFDPNLKSVDTDANIWARGISLIAPNTFAYAYQNGKNLKMMMKVVQLNETTHRMEVVAGPQEIAPGFSPYVSMLSVPYTAADPHTLTYFQDETGGTSKVHLCSWMPHEKKLDKCEDFVWLSSKLTSVSGVHLGGGKSFMVFTPESGVPYYGVFGLSKK